MKKTIYFCQSQSWANQIPESFLDNLCLYRSHCWNDDVNYFYNWADETYFSIRSFGAGGFSSNSWLD